MYDNHSHTYFYTHLFKKKIKIKRTNLAQNPVSCSFKRITNTQCGQEHNPKSHWSIEECIAEENMDQALKKK